jgi:uncharacterized membrane protein (DUF373 family)
MEKQKDLAHRMVDTTDVVVHWIEAVAAVLLAILAAAGVVFLIYEMVLAARRPSLASLEALFGAILLLFILIELYSIGTAFVRGDDVTNKIFEVGLVALVRQVIVAEFLHLSVEYMLTIAALIVALGIAWYLSRRALDYSAARKAEREAAEQAAAE